MFVLTDEKNQEWVFTDKDVSEDCLQAFKNISLGRGEMRIWREHVFSGFLASPSSEDTYSRLTEVIDDSIITGQLVKDPIVLKRIDDLIGHALQAHITCLYLTKRYLNVDKNGDEPT